uniref:Metallophosphoesterase n=2 Tax=environmental samples TaxID=651140 RepID=A0A075FY63_9ARCH|nr:metallophosphoesterase [uncultured marine thaumarchaeote AD1000_46_C12]AIE94479.1 metallophosphoesterase [uncultured marine thaumarchaeote AD1000_46_F05]
MVKKYLVITDLHIGFENEFVANKIEIGKNSTINETIEKLKSLIKIEKPDSVILLGDIKSSIKRITNIEWKEIPYFFEQIKKKLI